MDLARDICEMLQASAGSGRSAFQFCDTLFDKVTAAVRARFGITYLDAELMLAEIRHEHEDALFTALRNQVPLADATAIVALCLGDEP